MNRAKIRDVTILVFMIALVTVLIIVSLPYLNSPRFVKFIEDIGPFGPLVIILFTAVSQIFAPLPGSPAIIVSLAVFGWYQTRFYAYIGSLISAAVSFHIARKYGRNWVRKLAGKNSMDEIDEFASVEGTEALIIGRLLGFPLYDYISYAAGLTTMPFKKYYFITIVFGGIANFGFMLLFKNLDFSTTKGFMIWYGSMLISFPVFVFLIKKYIRHKKIRKKR